MSEQPTLPPLPEGQGQSKQFGPGSDYTADQMQAYARAAVADAVLAERERCAKLCEALSNSEYPRDCDDCAAAIRATPAAAIAGA